jgi:HAMP domain-containing protein
MTEQYIVWALVVGIVVGAALYWFALGRLPRTTDDVTPAERVVEAGWISRTIENRGGVAPTDLVEEVLDLHSTYLAGPALELTDAEGTAPADAATTPHDAAPAATASRPEGAPQDS